MRFLTFAIILNLIISFVNLIFNRNSQDIIGFEDKLMFSIQEDMKWFRDITSSSEKNIIVMGYFLLVEKRN